MFDQVRYLSVPPSPPPPFFFLCGGRGELQMTADPKSSNPFFQFHYLILTKKKQETFHLIQA